MVLDKGGLDALMGEDSVGGAEAGEKLLSEVARVLSPHGAYLCMTLAQSHVLSESLLAATACIAHTMYYQRIGHIPVSTLAQGSWWARMMESSAGLLLRYFRVGWQLQLAQIPPSPDMARSELQPLFVSAIKLDAGGAGSPSHVLSSLRPAPTSPNAAQLADVLQV